jgi:hypothetical protein
MDETTGRIKVNESLVTTPCIRVGEEEVWLHAFLTLVLGRSVLLVARAVSRRPLTAETPVRARVSPWVACGGQSSTGIHCHSVTFSVFPCKYHSTVAFHTQKSSSGRWTIGPLVAAVQRHSLTTSTWLTSICLTSWPLYSREDNMTPTRWAPDTLWTFWQWENLHLLETIPARPVCSLLTMIHPFWLLTPRNRTLLEQLIVIQIVKKWALFLRPLFLNLCGTADLAPKLVHKQINWNSDIKYGLSSCFCSSVE